MKQNKDKSWLEQLVKNYRIPSTELGNKPMLTEEQRRIINQSKSK
jgi:hypothetical protein